VRLNVLSAIVVSPRKRRLDLHAHICHGSIDTDVAIGFLRDVLRHERGPIFWFWDNVPFHKDPRVLAFLAQHPRLRICYFPTYAPELNPDEFVWTQLHDQLANSLLLDRPQLDQALADALCRTRDSQSLLRACIKSSGLPFKF
jgi:transposase